MVEICVNKFDGEWCWLNHVGIYHWDNEDYYILEVPDNYSVDEVYEYLKMYENTKSKV